MTRNNFPLLGNIDNRLVIYSIMSNRLLVTFWKKSAVNIWWLIIQRIFLARVNVCVEDENVCARVNMSLESFGVTLFWEAFCSCEHSRGHVTCLKIPAERPDDTPVQLVPRQKLSRWHPRPWFAWAKGGHSRFLVCQMKCECLAGRRKLDYGRRQAGDVILRGGFATTSSVRSSYLSD